MKTCIEIRVKYAGSAPETVDQYSNTREGRKEARRVLVEYRLSDRTGNYYTVRARCSEDEAQALIDADNYKEPATA